MIPRRTRMPVLLLDVNWRTDTLVSVDGGPAFAGPLFLV